MRRQTGTAVCGVLIGLLALFAGRNRAEENGFTLLKYHNADAKFIEDHIITSVGEGIQILDLSGNVVKEYDGLAASWIYVQEGEADEVLDCPAVVYSNHDNETHILQLAASKDFELLKDQTVLVTDTLAIDPILFADGDTWYLTHTLIDGTINNPDPEGENGTYTVRLYRSEDLEKWEQVTDIISRKQNLEDGDLRCVDGVFYFFFEMEEYDKGPSAICVMISKDKGKTWSTPKELLPPVADNEMAACERTEEGWRLYVSSDYACVGESYQGASVYYADYTPEFEPICTYQLSDMPDNQSVRLYEVKQMPGQLDFLFARNFLTDCDLLLRTLEKEGGH